MESLSFSIAATAAGERSHMEINALAINDVSFRGRHLFVGFLSYVVAFSLLARLEHCMRNDGEKQNGR